jgi:sugar phosphate isomerase/epimerase
VNVNDCKTTRLGIGSYTYPWAVGIPGRRPDRPLTALDLLDKAVALDVRVVQICDNLPLDLLTDTQRDELRQSAVQRDLTIEVGTRGIARDHLQRYLQLAVDFRSPILRVVIDTSEHHPALDEVVDLLRPMRRDLEQAGICLAIENHDRFAAGQFREIITRLDSPYVGLCLDTVNSFGALEGPTTVLAALAPWVVNLHVKEFAIQRVDHQLGFVIHGCPAGQGRLDVPWLLRELRAAGRTPNAILEQWPAPEPSLEATIAKEEQWAAASVKYLRTLIEN